MDAPPRSVRLAACKAGVLPVYACVHPCKGTRVMFGKAIPLFRVLGFSVSMDISWLFIALFITWSLAGGLFPAYFPGLTAATYWWMGIAGAFGLFFSLVLHELSHSVVARAYGLPIRGITLFLFGGVAEMEDEPPTAKAEFLMALAGPVASAVLSLGFYLLGTLGGGGPESLSENGTQGGWPVPAVGVAWYLAYLNGLLAAFNIIPAFPLDGGRMLRAALWARWADLRRATRAAARIGTAFSYVLIGLGVMNILSGHVVGGLWWCLIGLFLKGAAGASYYQVMVRRALEGEPVARFMTRDPVTVPPDITVRRFLDNHVYRHYHDMFPVCDNGRLLGCITTRHIRDVAKDDWDRTTVAALCDPCTPDNTVDAGEDAMKAIARMQRSGNSRLMVTDGPRLAGIIVLKDMLDLMALKIDLEAPD